MNENIAKVLLLVLLFTFIAFAVKYITLALITLVEKNVPGRDEKLKRTWGICANYIILLVYLLLFEVGVMASLMGWMLIFLLTYANYQWASNWKWFLFFQFNMLLSVMVGELASSQLYIKYISNDAETFLVCAAFFKLSCTIVLVLGTLFGVVKGISDYRKRKIGKKDERKEKEI